MKLKESVFKHTIKSFFEIEAIIKVYKDTFNDDAIIGEENDYLYGYRKSNMELDFRYDMIDNILYIDYNPYQLVRNGEWTF